MVENTIICLIVIALISLMRLRMRYDKVLSWLVFFAVVYLFESYCTSSISTNANNLSFLWSETRIGKITVTFTPTVSLNRLVIPLFFMTMMTILNNNIFRYEERRSAFNAFLLLNFVTLSLLMSAENYVQLITAVFVSDILGYLVLKDVDSSHRYVIYNLFADMCLFMVLALACGKIQSLELSSLSNYKKIGGHRDFVGLITAFAIFIKIGCFLFQSYLLDISTARFQRMSVINLMFSPLVGILLLVKLHDLLLVSNLFIPTLKIMSGTTFMAGLFYFVVKDNIQKKNVCLNMAFYGLLMYLLELCHFEWVTLLGYYLIMMYLFNQFIFKIYLYQNREQRVSRMLNAREINAVALQTIFMQVVFLAGLFFMLILKTSTALADNKIILAGVAILLALSIVLHHIYKSPHSYRLDYLNPNKWRVLSFLFNSTLLVVGGYVFEIYQWQSAIFVIVFMAITALPQWAKLRKLYEKEGLQKEDVSKSLFYYILVEPLKYLSRTLWLVVDFIFSEKMITSAFGTINKFSISCFFKLNQKSIVAGIIYIILGVLIFVASFYWRYFL